MAKITIGFWNYVACNVLDPETSVEDWRTLGMTTAMSCEYRSEADKAYMLRHLDAAARAGIGVIVCDARVKWSNYQEKGAEGYLADLRHAVEDFGHHKAFVAFHVGDEPDAANWEAMLFAASAVNRISRAFVNFLPFFTEEFEERLGTDHDGYANMLADAVRRTGLDLLCYDCYNQCLELDRETGIADYFYNLNRFSAIARECGVDLGTCLLSVGHWHYRVPDENDLRWQLSTAAAHGVSCMMWFYVYARFLESSYRNSPFDLYWHRTETFDRLSRQNHIFSDHYAARLSDARLRKIRHFRTSYGGTPLYTEGCIEGLILTEKFGVPLIVSEFEDAEGRFVVLVNNSQTISAKCAVTRKGVQSVVWLAPGQLEILKL